MPAKCQQAHARQNTGGLDFVKSGTVNRCLLAWTFQGSLSLFSRVSCSPRLTQRKTRVSDIVMSGCLRVHGIGGQNDGVSSSGAWALHLTFYSVHFALLNSIPLNVAQRCSTPLCSTFFYFPLGRDNVPQLEPFVSLTKTNVQTQTQPFRNKTLCSLGPDHYGWAQ